MVRGEWFARAVRSVLRRPLVVLGALAVLVVVALCAGDAARAVGVDRHARRRGLGRLPGHRALQAGVRRRGGRRARARRAPAARPDAEPEPDHLARGLHRRQPAAREPRAGAAPDARASAASSPSSSPRAPSTGRARSSTRRSRAPSEWISGRAQSANQRAEQAAEAARKASRERGDSKREQDRLAENARQLVMSEFQRDLVGLAVRYNICRAPGLDRVHLRARVRQQRRGRAAEVALRVPVPVEGRRDDHGAAAAGPDRRGALARDRPDQAGDLTIARSGSTAGATS